MLTSAQSVRAAQVVLCCPSSSACPEGRLIALTLKRVSDYPTWNAGGSSCGADSQKLREGRRKGTQKGVWHTEREVGSSWLGITVSLGKRLQSPRRAVVEGCCTAVFLLCCLFYFAAAVLKVSEYPCVLLLTSTTAAAPELVFIVWCKSSNFCSRISTLGGTFAEQRGVLKKKKSRYSLSCHWMVLQFGKGHA